MDYKLALDIGLFFVTVGVALYAIHDVRTRVKSLIEVERNLAWSRLLNDLVWDYVEPTGGGRTKETAKALSQFTHLAQILNPERKIETFIEAAEKESLFLADQLSKSGHAVWKNTLDLGDVRKMLADWAEQKETARSEQSKMKHFRFWR